MWLIFLMKYRFCLISLLKLPPPCQRNGFEDKFVEIIE